jgi:uncharacterized protein (TIGR02118 family)
LELHAPAHAARSRQSTTQEQAMFKFIGTMSAKRNLEPERFREYYEEHHAPLIHSLFPLFKGYRRNYIDRAQSEFRGRPAPTFDVMTEVWFESRAAFAEFRVKLSDPKILQVIMDDESHFLDRSMTQLLVVEEKVTL